MMPPRSAGRSPRGYAVWIWTSSAFRYASTDNNKLLGLGLLEHNV